MTNLLLLVPIALGLGLLGLGAFFWSLRSGQMDDPEGDAMRILLHDEREPAALSRPPECNREG